MKIVHINLSLFRKFQVSVDTDTQGVHFGKTIRLSYIIKTTLSSILECHFIGIVTPYSNGTVERYPSVHKVIWTFGKFLVCSRQNGGLPHHILFSIFMLKFLEPEMY